MVRDMMMKREKVESKTRMEVMVEKAVKVK